tara:strand:- start:236 stop:445 length:210 start_codon:yes stop_codon:yes gene_type:complete
METEYLWQEEARRAREAEKEVKCKFTWVNGDYEIFTDVVWAETKEKAIIEFFEWIGKRSDIKNYEFEIL